VHGIGSDIGRASGGCLLLSLLDLSSEFCQPLLRGHARTPLAAKPGVCLDERKQEQEEPGDHDTSSAHSCLLI
jgi:hypothetical protein